MEIYLQRKSIKEYDSTQYDFEKAFSAHFLKRIAEDSLSKVYKQPNIKINHKLNPTLLDMSSIRYPMEREINRYRSHYDFDELRKYIKANLPDIPFQQDYRDCYLQFIELKTQQTNSEVKKRRDNLKNTDDISLFNQVLKDIHFDNKYKNLANSRFTKKRTGKPQTRYQAAEFAFLEIYRFWEKIFLEYSRHFTDSGKKREEIFCRIVISLDILSKVVTDQFTEIWIVEVNTLEHAGKLTELDQLLKYLYTDYGWEIVQAFKKNFAKSYPDFEKLPFIAPDERSIIMGTILEKLDTIEKKLDDSDRENQSHKTQLILDQEEQFVLRLFELLFPNLQANVKDSIKNIGSSRSFFSDFLNHAVTLKQIEWGMLGQTFPSKKYSVDKIRKTVEMNNRLR